MDTGGRTGEFVGISFMQINLILYIIYTDRPLCRGLEGLVKYLLPVI